MSKRDLRRIPEYSEFRKFLVNETNQVLLHSLIHLPPFDGKCACFVRTTQGNFCRQEAVSMIPPLLLDVKSNHMVRGLFDTKHKYTLCGVI
jgi:16S rRNA C967 or C1407 C5-methylase (RsmB/RsmF family)